MHDSRNHTLPCLHEVFSSIESMLLRACPSFKGMRQNHASCARLFTWYKLEMNFKIFQICTFETFRLIHNITKGDTETRAGHCSVTWAEAESNETRHSFAGAHWPMRIKYFFHWPIRSWRATARSVTQRSLRVVKYRSGSAARAAPHTKFHCSCLCPGYPGQHCQLQSNTRASQS